MRRSLWGDVFFLMVVAILCCGGLFQPVRAAAVESRLETAGIATSQFSEVGVRRFLPDLDVVDRRLNYYRERVAGWKLVAEFALQKESDASGQEKITTCKASVDKVVIGYERLKKIVVDGALKEGDPRPWDVVFDDIHYLESGCESMYEQAAKLADKSKSALQDAGAAKVEPNIFSLFTEENFQGVIIAFEKARAENVNWDPGPAVKKEYGLSLVRLGRFKDAAQFLRDSIALEPDDDSKLSMTRLVADLLLATGNIREAQGYYLKLSAKEVEFNGLLASPDLRSEELAAFLRVLKSSLAYNGKWLPSELTRSVNAFFESFPESGFQKRVREIHDEVKEQSQKWLESQEAQLESLLADKNFNQAKGLIDYVLSGALSDEKRESLFTMKEEVLLAEAKELEFQKQAMEQKQALEWSEALNLLDSRKYDEAIAALGTFIGTSYEEEARGKMESAANQAANDNRRQAANLFVKVRKAQDQKYKQELLLESRQLLLDILTKYPRTEIIEKVKQNLKIIEEQIRNIDPGLLKSDSDSQKAKQGE